MSRANTKLAEALVESTIQATLALSPEHVAKEIVFALDDAGLIASDVRPSRSWPDPLTVTCPKCQVSAGMLCVEPSEDYVKEEYGKEFTSVPPHEVRGEAAQLQHDWDHNVTRVPLTGDDEPMGRSSPLDVDCPYCLVIAGQTCKRGSGRSYVKYTHQSRLDAWVKLDAPEIIDQLARSVVRIASAVSTLWAQQDMGNEHRGFMEAIVEGGGYVR